MCEARVPLVAAAFFEVAFICFQSFSLPSFNCATSFLPEQTEKYFQFKGKINKVFIETAEPTFGKFFEMFSPRFGFKLFKLRRQTYPFQT